MAGITTDSASNNKRAFKNDEYTWFPCFGHILHNAVNQAIGIDRVSGALSRLRKTISAFTRSPKLTRQFDKKQSEINDLPGHKLIHDAATKWSSTYDMVERFLEQQQAVCAVLIEDRKKWHLMPKEADITTLEIVKNFLEPLSPFTDALSGEKNTTLSSVLPVMWKISTYLSDEQDDSALAGQMKRAIRDYLDEHYQDKKLQLLLNTATYLDPRFKDSFVSLEDDVKQNLLDQVREVRESAAADVALPGGPGQAEPSASQARPSKKTKTDLKHLLSNIQGQKNGSDASATQEVLFLTPSEKLNGEFLIYSRMPELDADSEQDPLLVENP
ncbi:zinc finger BED domain-containing protein 4-like [Acanthochromis polyacanthus]|uniref:zinc finger BED domain-containing protein 4-like n=1 Tax=Acanthochromis polyacanthus TaxID=80966 RepID=UPI002234B660|nr:zinc finger BED domain-containing protein 4-like [Acanthochromis polyacanthus]